MPKTNIVPLVKPKYAKRLANEDETLMVLRLAMYGRPTDQLAKDVGVTSSCIYSIQSGRTKWPRPNTFFGLLRALELEMHLIPRGTNDRY